MIKSKIWVNKIVKTKYFQKKGLFKIDISLRNELLRRYINDQDASNPKRKEFIKENSAWFREKLLTNEFPSQQRVGIFTKDNRIEDNPYEVMLLHYFDNLRPKGKDKLQPDSLKLAELLFQLVKKSDINPNYFASFNNVVPTHNLNPMNSFYFIVTGDSVFVQLTTTDRLNQINQERVKNGMNTVEEYMKIIRFNAIDRRFYLTAGICTGIFPDFVKEDFSRAGAGYKNIGHKKEILNIN